MNCDLPGRLVSGCKVDHLEICYDVSGLFVVSNFSNMSPRTVDNGCCPLAQGCSFNLGMAFWALAAVELGCGFVKLVLTYNLNLDSYGSDFLSEGPGSRLSSTSF